MSKFRLKINVPGFNEARRSPAIQEELHRRGVQMAEAAGGQEDFRVIDSPSPQRARTVVVTATVEAMLAEAKDRRLTRAFDAGRG